MKYFGPGLWHGAVALAFAATLGIFEHGEPTSRLMDAPFLCALVFSSSALFFVPDRWAKKGLLKFLHYPLPDWDVLLLGPASHRHWLSHSPLLPVTLSTMHIALPQGWAQFSPATSMALGLCVGIASHLFWDCVGSRSHTIVVVPHWWSLRESASRLWLLGGAAISVACAPFFADNIWARHWVQNLRMWLKQVL